MSPFRPRFGRPRHNERKHIGALIGAGAGMIGGAYLGAAIEGDRCRCDDPGFTGGMMGDAIGAVAGGIAGAATASR